MSLFLVKIGRKNIFTKKELCGYFLSLLSLFLKLIQMMAFCFCLSACFACPTNCQDWGDLCIEIEDVQLVTYLICLMSFLHALSMVFIKVSAVLSSQWQPKHSLIFLC